MFLNWKPLPYGDLQPTTKASPPAAFLRDLWSYVPRFYTIWNVLECLIIFMRELHPLTNLLLDHITIVTKTAAYFGSSGEPSTMRPSERWKLNLIPLPYLDKSKPKVAMPCFNLYLRYWSSDSLFFLDFCWGDGGSHLSFSMRWVH